MLASVGVAFLCWQSKARLSRYLFIVFLLLPSFAYSFPSFELLNQGPYQGPFYGGLHSHTTYAMPNFAGTPLDAFQTARFYILPGTEFNMNAGTHFWGVTDYYWALVALKQNWGKTLQEARQIREEGFPALVGWEWSILKPGVPEQRDHINCFPLNQTSPPLPPSKELSTFSGLYQYAADTSTPHVCQFNHPEMRSAEEPLPAFEQFRYDESGDNAISLIEIKGMNGGFRGYFQALNNGWHLSPVRNEDNKEWTWGLQISEHGAQRRAGVFAKECSVDGIMDSLRNGVTFAATDKSLSAWIAVDGNQKHLPEKYRKQKTVYFMGSVFYGVKTLQLSLHCKDSDPKEQTILPYFPVLCDKKGCFPPEKERSGKMKPDSPYFSSAYLYTNGGTKTAQAPVPISSGRIVKEWKNLHTRDFKQTFLVKPAEDGTNEENTTESIWYVLRLVQEDGDEVITAPLYVHL